MLKAQESSTDMECNDDQGEGETAMTEVQTTQR